MLDLSPNDPIVKTYLKDLQLLKDHSIAHETGLRRPFENLLDKAAKKLGWTVVAELSISAGGRRQILNDAAQTRFRQHYTDDTITKEAIFHYISALLHHPEYRERYAANLKRELPRIPFAPDFHAFAQAGRTLAHLHTTYESLQPHPSNSSKPRASPTPSGSKK